MKRAYALVICFVSFLIITGPLPATAGSSNQDFIDRTEILSLMSEIENGLVVIETEIFTADLSRLLIDVARAELISTKKWKKKDEAGYKKNVREIEATRNKLLSLRSRSLVALSHADQMLKRVGQTLEKTNL